jgi:hypothetical protein
MSDASQYALFNPPKNTRSRIKKIKLVLSNFLHAKLFHRIGLPLRSPVCFHCIIIVIIIKVKLSLCLTNKAPRHEGPWGSRFMNPRFLDLGTSWWVVSFTLRPLYPPGWSPRYPFDRRLGEPQNRSKHGDNSCPYRDSNSDPLVI